MKSLLFFWLILLFSMPVAAQERCNLEMANAPVLQNLRLGMTPVEVQNVFGRDLKIKIKKNGNRVFFQNFITKSPPPILNGVRALYLRFLDRKLYQIEIFYENKPEWKTLANFTNALSANLNLPDLWEDVRGRQALNCAGFSVFADKVLNPRVELTDEQTRARAEELLEKEKSKK